MKFLILAIALAVFVPLGASSASNGPGSLDLSFGVDGIAFGHAEPSAGNAVAVQADGKIVIAGRDDATSSWLIVRLNVDGSVDSTFTPELFFPGGTISHHRATDVDIDSQGRIVVTGRKHLSGQAAPFAVIRLLPTTGARDQSFGNNGVAEVKIADASVSMGVKVQPLDDKIVVSGAISSNSYWGFGIARFNTNGSLDTQSFGTQVKPARGSNPAVYAGYLIHQIDSQQQDQPRNGTIALQLDANGQVLGILVGGHSGTSGQNYFQSWLIARYTPNGLVDTSFGSSGVATTVFSGVEVKIDGLKVGFGRIYASGNGWMQSPDPTMHPTVLAAYDATNGSPVTTDAWGPSGTITVGQPGLIMLNGMACAVQDDGKIVVGATYFDGEIGGIVTLRFLDSGILDDTFGTFGMSELASGPGWLYADPNDIALDGDGIILATGMGVGSYLGAVRFLAAEGSGFLSPTGLVADPIDTDSIELVWNSRTGGEEDGFEIWRSMDGLAWGGMPVHSTGKNVTTWTDTQLDPNTTYYYRVRAYKGEEVSGFSNVAFATTEALPPEPEVKVSISSDKDKYTTGEVEAILTVTVTNEYNLGIEGLSVGNFQVNGAPVNAIAGGTNGIYTITIDIHEFVAGTYPIGVTVTDNRIPPETGGDSIDIVIEDPAIGTLMYVASIGYHMSGLHLNVTITVGSPSPGVDLSGVQVSITLLRDGGNGINYSGPTDASGVVSFRLNRAPKGTYSTNIDDLVKEGFIYDPGLNASDPGFTR